MANRLALCLAMSLTLVSGQRPSFAGSRPIGYPELITSTTEGLANRFGEDDVTSTTQRLPIEANGDKNLIDRLSKLPVDKQPFWFINWQAYEAHRQNPQTFPQKPNVFVDPMTGNPQINQFNQGNVNMQNGQFANPAFNQQPNQLPPTNINPQINNRNFETASNLPLNTNQFAYPNSAFINQQPNRLPTQSNVYPQQNLFHIRDHTIPPKYVPLNNQIHMLSGQTQGLTTQTSQHPPGSNNNYSGYISSTHIPSASQHR